MKGVISGDRLPKASWLAGRLLVTFLFSLAVLNVQSLLFLVPRVEFAEGLNFETGLGALLKVTSPHVLMVYASPLFVAYIVWMASGVRLTDPLSPVCLVILGFCWNAASILLIVYVAKERELSGYPLEGSEVIRAAWNIIVLSILVAGVLVARRWRRDE